MLMSTNSSANTSGSGCGYFPNKGGNFVVVASPAGGGTIVTVSDPSGFVDCDTTYHQSEPDVRGFTACEVFLVTIASRPNVTFALETGSVSLSAQQLASGVNNTIWTDFNPAVVTTNSNGTAYSNLTLAGAGAVVMPSVLNDSVGIVGLPITAQSKSGLEATVSLPIEFDGLEEGGLEPVNIFRSPGPVLFSGTSSMVAQEGEIEYWYGLVYAPIGSNATTPPLHVSLNVAGSWNDGSVGALPSGVQVSFAPQSFDLKPNQIFYFWVDANNSLVPRGVPEIDNYTFAIQESVGNAAYLVPLHVSVALNFPLSLPVRTALSGWPWIGGFGVLVLITAGIALVVVASLILFNRRKVPSGASARFLLIAVVGGVGRCHHVSAHALRWQLRGG